MYHRALIVASCLPLLVTACRTSDNGSSDRMVRVAAIGGEPITIEELDGWIKDDWFERESGGGNPAKLYELRSESLDRMISARVLEEEASRRNLDVEELITSEVDALGEVPGAEIAAFYAQNLSRMQGRRLDEMRDPIREFLTRERSKQVIASLRKSADVEIFLTAPRLRIAADGPSRGAADAPVTIVEFSDFQCPFCGRARPILDEVLERYPEQVRLVYRHMPLDSIHPRARAAAEASACAQEQGEFWAYHDRIFDEPDKLADEDLLGHAQALGLDSEGFDACMKERRYRIQVETDAADARAAGLTGTPAFFINGILLTGAKPAAEFNKIIDAELAGS